MKLSCWKADSLGWLVKRSLLRLCSPGVLTHSENAPLGAFLLGYLARPEGPPVRSTTRFTSENACVPGIPDSPPRPGIIPSPTLGAYSQHDYANANFWIVSFLHQTQWGPILARRGKVARLGVFVQTPGSCAKPQYPMVVRQPLTTFGTSESVLEGA
jgi:hypothetical protein